MKVHIKSIFLFAALSSGAEALAQTNYYATNKAQDNACYVAKKKKPGSAISGSNPLFPIAVTRDSLQVIPNVTDSSVALNFPNSVDLYKEAKLDPVSCMGRMGFSYEVDESTDGVNYTAIANSSSLELTDATNKYSDASLNPNKTYKSVWRGFQPLAGSPVVVKKVTTATQLPSMYCLNGVQQCTNVCLASSVQAAAKKDKASVFKVGVCTPDTALPPPYYTGSFSYNYEGPATPDMFRKSPKYGISYHAAGFETDGIDQDKIAWRIQQAQKGIDALQAYPDQQAWYKARVTELASTPGIYGQMVDTCYEETKARYLACNTKKLNAAVAAVEKARLGKGTYPMRVQIVPTFFYVSVSDTAPTTLISGLTYNWTIYAVTTAAWPGHVENTKDIMCWEMGNLFAGAAKYNPKTVAEEVGYTSPCDKVK